MDNRPIVLMHYDEDGVFTYAVHGDARVVTVDERCKNDRVYEGSSSIDRAAIEMVIEGKAHTIYDALDILEGSLKRAN